MRFQPGEARSTHRNPGSDSHFDVRPRHRFDCDAHGNIIDPKHGNAQLDADIDGYRDTQDPYCPLTARNSHSAAWKPDALFW